MAPSWSVRQASISAPCKEKEINCNLDETEIVDAFDFDVIEIQPNDSHIPCGSGALASRGYLQSLLKDECDIDELAKSLPSPLRKQIRSSSPTKAFRPSSSTFDLSCHRPVKVTSGVPLASQHEQRSAAAGKARTPRSFQRPHAANGGTRSFVDQICPGDVLNIVSDRSAMTRLGAAGGFMGHVLLAVSSPTPLDTRSELGGAFQNFSSDGSHELYSVDILECTRAAEGLYETSVVLSLGKDGRVFLCGEQNKDDIFIAEDLEQVHIWQSPAQLRRQNFRSDVMVKVLEDMRTYQHNWSWSTAVRAFFLSGDISSSKPITIKEIQDSWKAEPICTSIVVIFWQRYLHGIATIERVNPLNLIMQVMPLRADRALPGELLSTMLAQGWSLADDLNNPQSSGNRSRASTM